MYEDYLALAAEQRRHLSMWNIVYRVAPPREEMEKADRFERQANDHLQDYNSHASCTARRYAAQATLRSGDLSGLESEE